MLTWDLVCAAGFVSWEVELHSCRRSPWHFGVSCLEEMLLFVDEQLATWFQTPLLLTQCKIWGSHLCYIKMFWGTWVAQSVERLALDFGSGHDSGVTGLSPVSSSALCVEPA